MDATLLKGLRMLEALARSSKPRGVTELAAELGLGKSNAHRTLQGLLASGFATSDVEGRYACTLKLFELGSLVADRIDVRAIAEPMMVSLCEQSRETVHLAVLDSVDVVYLHKVESPEPVRAYSRIGGRAPAHCVASGKALLAYQSMEWLDTYLPDELPRFTDATHTDSGELRDELRRIRNTGYAVNTGEWRAEVGGVAAVILDAVGKPIGAIGVSGPVDRVAPRVPDHGTKVMAAAAGISARLGCRNYSGSIAHWKE